MKVSYHDHTQSPWNRAFDLLRTHPGQLRSFVDVTDPEKLPGDLSAYTKTKINRRDVVAILKEKKAGCETSLEALNHDDCLVVTTGQQPGFLGGPVFTLYKILTAVALANQLAEKLQVPVVPLFCNASDDHDWNEANQLSLWRQSSWQTLRWPQELPGAHLYEKPMPSFQEIQKTFDLEGQIFESFSESGISLSENFTNILRQFFADTNLVIIEPHWFRALACEFNQKAFELTDVIDQNLLMAGSALGLSRLPQILKPKEGGYLCFSRDGRRERLQTLAQNRWGGRKGELGDAQKIRELIEQEPQMWSPNVVTRPIWMRWLFPVVADVVGPSEAAYQLQIQQTFERFEVCAPVLVPRLSATFLRPRDTQKLEKLSAEPWSLPKDYRVQMDPQFKESFKDRLSGIESLVSHLGKSIETAYPELEGKVKKTIAYLDRDLKRLEPMIIKAQENREATKLDQWHSLASWCQPEGQLQERGASIFGMSSFFGGMKWWESFVKTVDPLSRKPAWVEITGDEIEN